MKRKKKAEEKPREQETKRRVKRRGRKRHRLVAPASKNSPSGPVLLIPLIYS